MQHFLHSKLGHVQKKKKSLASYWCDLCLGVKTFLALVITMILFQICAYNVVVYYKLNIILLSLYIIHWNLSLLNNIQPHCIEVGFHQRLSWRQSQSDTMWKKTKQIRSKLSTLLMTLLVMIYKNYHSIYAIACTIQFCQDHKHQIQKQNYIQPFSVGWGLMDV